MPDTYVFAFEEGSKEQKFLLGGKGANLAEMTIIGLPVPPGLPLADDCAPTAWRISTCGNTDSGRTDARWPCIS